MSNLARANYESFHKSYSVDLQLHFVLAQISEAKKKCLSWNQRGQLPGKDISFSECECKILMNSFSV